jgi:hypothetical protein
MSIVVVGGQARKVGKTSVMVGLIRGLRSRGWAAVKISRHGARLPHLVEAAGRRRAGRAGFILTEEHQASAATDTGRFLAAGAKRAFWLRTRTDRLGEAVRELLAALEGERNLMIESSSIVEHLTPTVCLFVVDCSRRQLKAGTRRWLARADAVIQVKAGKDDPRPSLWVPGDVPVFSVTQRSYDDPRLCQFVRQKLQSLAHSQSKPSAAFRRVAVGERNRCVGPQQS